MRSSPQPPTAGRTTHRRAAGIHRTAAMLVGLLGLVAAWILSDDGMDGELRKLPEAERRALHLRTVETLRTTCSNASGPELTEYCRDQAEFLVGFPECSRSCRELAQRYAPKPAH